MRSLKRTTRPFLLLALSLLLLAGCTSEPDTTDAADSQSSEFTPSDQVHIQSGPVDSTDLDTSTVHVLETVSSVHFSAWTSRSDIHLQCSPKYHIIPDKIDERIIDGFSSMPSLEEITIRLAFNLDTQHVSIPIQDGLSRVIAFSPGVTLAMASSTMYRSKRTCGRITATRTGSETEEMFFSTWTGKDSIGLSFHKPDGSLMWGGITAQSFAESTTAQSLEGGRAEAVEFPEARVLQADGKWLFDIERSGRVTLSQLLPFGRWKLRHANVVYDDYPFVVEYTCDPYKESNDFCGFPSQDGILMADPPSPARIHFAIKDSSRGDSLIVKPVWEENAGGYVLSHFTDMEIGENIKLALFR